MTGSDRLDPDMPESARAVIREASALAAQGKRGAATKLLAAFHSEHPEDARYVVHYLAELAAARIGRTLGNG